MGQRITMTDVAREAGVSLMTVSRVINNKSEVSTDTRERVLKVIEHMGYRPSGIARGLVTQHTRTFGIVLPDISNPFFANLVRGAEEEAYSNGYSVFLCNTGENPSREIAVLQSLEEKRVDGLILCASRLDEGELSKVIRWFPNVVQVLRQSKDNGESVLLTDDQAGGLMATHHLVRAGHERIGFIAGPSRSYSSKQRLLGYQTAMQSSSLFSDNEYIQYCPPTVQGGYQSSMELLEAKPDLTALLCFNDLVAVGVMQAASELGKKIPADLAIIGFDDIPLAALVTPALTTVRIPQYKLGSRAMLQLLDLVENKNLKPKYELIRPELIIRDSSP